MLEGNSRTANWHCRKRTSSQPMPPHFLYTSLRSERPGSPLKTLLPQQPSLQPTPSSILLRPSTVVEGFPLSVMVVFTFSTATNLSPHLISMLFTVTYSVHIHIVILHLAHWASFWSNLTLMSNFLVDGQSLIIRGDFNISSYHQVHILFFVRPVLLLLTHNTQLTFSLPPSDTLVQRISACLVDISSWMAAHHLKLHPDKTEVIFFPRKSSLFQDLTITIDNTVVSFLARQSSWGSP